LKGGGSFSLRTTNIEEVEKGCGRWGQAFEKQPQSTNFWRDCIHEQLAVQTETNCHSRQTCAVPSKGSGARVYFTTWKKIHWHPRGRGTNQKADLKPLQVLMARAKKKTYDGKRERPLSELKIGLIKDVVFTRPYLVADQVGKTPRKKDLAMGSRTGGCSIHDETAENSRWFRGLKTRSKGDGGRLRLEHPPMGSVPSKKKLSVGNSAKKRRRAD